MNGAESLLRTLVNTGVEVCFANPGTSEMHFVSALDRVEGMRPILGLFEGVVTGAADGYARMTGKPAATLLHLGPGMGNGLACLHNARKAGSPVINIIGDHATHHRRFEAPLTSEVETFARTVSHWVRTTRDARSVAADTALAVQAARAHPGQIASLILPADAAWDAAERPAQKLPEAPRAQVSDEAISQVAAILKSKKVAIMLRGDVLEDEGLIAAGRIASLTGARLVCDTYTPKIQKGAGRVKVERLPYRPTPAIEFLKGIEMMVLVGTQPPVAFFAYPGLPNELTPAGCGVMTLSFPHEDGTSALIALADYIGAPPTPTLVRDSLPKFSLGLNALTSAEVGRIVADNLPVNAIICDESITASAGHFAIFDCAAPSDYLQTTGGAIGHGLPMAVGASVACPDRKVIVLEGDGSAMYTIQSLWTMAKEQLDVTVVIYANNTYAILRDELINVGATEGPQASAVFDINGPVIDWVRMANSMGVEAAVASTPSQFSDIFKSAMKYNGPFLIAASV
ncbi:acetolactate synthase large subunit [Pantoea rwandensis]|uniref:Acetolactate synthase large subunit n=2 Tax=Pantoea rwandensis TaxID=1076550 RepID=A0A1X1D3N6_9GAMM|nr:acetolactate synthase large subunit [Pantoea rwandensis]